MGHQEDILVFNNLTSQSLEIDQCLANNHTYIPLSLPDEMASTSSSQNTTTESFYDSALSSISAVTTFLEQKINATPNLAEEVSNSINSLNKFTGDYITLENTMTLATFALQGYLSFQIGGFNIALLAVHLGLSVSQPYIDSYWKSFVDSLEDGTTKDILSSIKLGKFITLLSSTQLGISNGIKAYSLFKNSAILTKTVNSDIGQYFASLPIAKSMTFSHFQSVTAKPLSVLFTDYLTDKFKPAFWGATEAIFEITGVEFTAPKITSKPADLEKTALDMAKKAPEIIIKSFGAPMPVYIAAGEAVKELWYDAKSVIKDDNFMSYDTIQSVFSYKAIESTKDFITSISLKGTYETIARTIAPQYSVNHLHSELYLFVKEVFKVSETVIYDKFCQKNSSWQNLYYLIGWQYNDDLDDLKKSATA